MIRRFRSENWTDPLNSPFALGVERSRKLSDMERITFRIGAFQVTIITKIVRPVGSSVNRRAIQYGFRATLIIDQVWCEHGLKLQKQNDDTTTLA